MAVSGKTFEQKNEAGKKDPCLPSIPENIYVNPHGELIATEEALTNVQFPFFMGKKDNSTLYILGTCHALPLSSLQESALSYIKEAKVALFESTKSALSSISIQKLHDSGVILREQEENDDWYKPLSSESLDNLKYSVKRFFDLTNIPPVPLKKINPDFALIICYLARRPNICMDAELINLFDKNAVSLEGIERIDMLFKKQTLPIPELEDFLLDNIPLSFITFSFSIEDAKRNFKWIHKIIQTSAHSTEPVFVAVGSAHLAGATGLISLLHQFGYEFSVMQNGQFQSYNVLTDSPDDPMGKELLENINSKVSQDIENMLPSAIPDSKPRKIISSYLSFSLFPEYSKTLSEHVKIQNTLDSVTIELDLSRACLQFARLR